MENQGRKQLVLQQLKNSGSMQTLDLIGDLIGCLMEELRFDNDVAAHEEVLRNQGGIKMCNEMLQVLDIKA